MLTGECLDPHIPGYEFTDHYNCALSGYSVSHETLKLLLEDENYGLERLNRERLAVRFECRSINSA
tara:strand:+ start:432 stop:629 length:198 start_codon:yes stop_codon:yes gene_type:complete